MVEYPHFGPVRRRFFDCCFQVRERLETRARSRPFLNYKTLKPQNVRSSPSQTTDSGSNSYSSNMQRSLSTIQLFSFGKALEW